MLEEDHLPEYFLSGNPRKLYWISTRGLGVLLSVSLFYTLFPSVNSVINTGEFPSEVRLLATSIFASSLLTFALIAVYRDLGETQAQQAEIMDRQRELRALELNREVREKHTEVLRHRVEEWLGKPIAEKDEMGDLTDQTTGLPKIKGATVQPAPKQFGGRERREAFRAAPAWLEGEQYFEDLLENHAPDLKKLKEQIETQHNEYLRLREEFNDGFEGGPEKDTEHYKIVPDRNFSTWVFIQIMLLERGLESKEDLIDLASHVVQTDSIAREGTRYYPGKEVYASPSNVYKAISKTGDLEIFSQYGNRVEDDIILILTDTIQDLEHQEQYNTAKKAAQRLDNMSQTTNQLRFKLNEYQGLPLYPGQCEYLEEELIYG